MPRKHKQDESKRERKNKAEDQFAPETARLDTTVALESEPFVAFEQWMDQELDKLVARWLPFAAPRAALSAHSHFFGRGR